MNVIGSHNVEDGALHILAANPKRARLFLDKSFQDNEDVYRPFLRYVSRLQNCSGYRCKIGHQVARG